MFVRNRFAYVEFLEVEAVQNAILLSESELHNRPLKVFILLSLRVTRFCHEMFN